MLGLEEKPSEPQKPWDSKEIMKKRREKAICIVSTQIDINIDRKKDKYMYICSYMYIYIERERELIDI